MATTALAPEFEPGTNPLDSLLASGPLTGEGYSDLSPLEAAKPALDDEDDPDATEDDDEDEDDDLDDEDDDLEDDDLDEDEDDDEDLEDDEEEDDENQDDDEELEDDDDPKPLKVKSRA